MTRTLLKRWSDLAAEHASRRVAALYLLHRVLQKLSGGHVAIVPYALVAQPIGNPALVDVRPDAQTVVRRIAADDPVIAAFPRPPDVVARRFLDGSSCYVAWVKGQFAGHIWIARDRYREDEVRCVYAIDEPETGVWDFDVFIVPSLRLGRTLSRLWKAVDDALALEGVKWSFSRINRFNSVSMRSHLRLGAHRAGEVLVLRLWGIQLAAHRRPQGRWAIGFREPTVPVSAAGDPRRATQARA